MTEPQDSNRPEHGLDEDRRKDEAQESEEILDAEQGPQRRDTDGESAHDSRATPGEPPD